MKSLTYYCLLPVLQLSCIAFTLTDGSRRTFGGGFACPGGAYCAEVGVAEIANSASRSAAKKKDADWAAAFSTVLHVRCNSSSKDDLTAARPVSPANAKAPESGPRTRVRSSIVFPTLDLHEIS